MKGTGVGLARRCLGLVLRSICCLGSALAAAQTPDAVLKQLNASAAERQSVIERGRKATFFCSNCHGAEGLSKFPEVPNLAGQNPAYLLRQLDAFTTGRRRNEFMEGLVKMLPVEDRAAIALYYASLPVKPSRPAPGPLAQAGSEAFARVCTGCHGPQALGGNEFPRLAGQQAEYLRINLKRYLHPSKERSYGPMTAAVMRLGEENIEPVVDYLSSLPIE